MRKVVFLAIFILFLTFPSKLFAIEDPRNLPNNPFGIHILFTNELESSAKLVNSNGGDWGYVTIPIQSTDRSLEKWQKFMDDSKRLHIIPIIRIATYPQSNFWTRPTIFDHIDFANFLNSLSWPTKNRYIIVYNEPNSNLEWGGAVDAAHYAEELSRTIDAFKRVNEDFFIISAGLDSYAPERGSLYKDAYNFLAEMDRAVPGIFSRIDGLASHSYPSRSFTANPRLEVRGGVISYREELAFIRDRFGRSDLPVFITETGWQQSVLSEDEVASFYQYAFQNIWKEKNIVAVTPFLLNGQASAFSGFSLLRNDGSPNKIFEAIANLPKVKGAPTITQEEEGKRKIVAAEYIKNLQDINADLPGVELSPPLRVFLRWFFER